MILAPEHNQAAAATPPMAAVPAVEGLQRRCIVTGLLKDKADLIRFVVGPDGNAVPDLKGNLPGRGLWVSAARDAVRRAVRTKAFAKAAKGPVLASPDLPDRIEHLLVRQILDLLGLAKRSSQLVAGFEKVESWLKAGRASLLIEAADSAQDGRTKLSRLAQPGVEIWALLSGDELAPAIGRPHVMHVAVAKGGLAEALRLAMHRLKAFRDDRPASKTLNEAARPKWDRQERDRQKA